MKAIGISLIVALCSGCSTVVVRKDGDGYGQFFPAVKNDVKMIDSAYSQNNWLFPPEYLHFLQS